MLQSAEQALLHLLCGLPLLLVQDRCVDSRLEAFLLNKQAGKGIALRDCDGTYFFLVERSTCGRALHLTSSINQVAKQHSNPRTLVAPYRSHLGGLFFTQIEFANYITERTMMVASTPVPSMTSSEICTSHNYNKND